MKKSITVTLLFMIILLGCNTASKIDITTTPDLSLTPFASNTKTLIPSHTPVPTKTPTLIPTLNPTEKAVATILESTSVAELTQSAILQDEIKKFETTSNNDCESFGISLSPDKNWIAINCVLESMFRVSNQDGSKQFEISYEEISNIVLEDPSNRFVMLGSVYPLFWSNDGRFLFFSETVCCVDTDGFGWNDSLLRLNLKTGEWKEVVSGGANYFSFSPKGTKLIHIPHDVSGAGRPVIINIIDLETWSQTQFLLNEYEQAGSLIWSPDESSIVLTAKIGDYYAGDGRYSILIIDLINDAYKNIIKDNIYFIKSENWSENDIITLSESCTVIRSFDCFKQFLFYDLNQGKFVFAP